MKFRNTVIYIVLCEFAILQSVRATIKDSFYAFRSVNNILEVTVKIFFCIISLYIGVLTVKFKLPVICFYFFKVNIVQNCLYGNSQNIVLSSDFENTTNTFLLKKIFASSIPTKLIGLYETEIYKKHKYVQNNHLLRNKIVRHKTYKTKSYIIVVPSDISLTLALQRLKDSLLWNYKGFYFIVITNLKTGCAMARDFFHLVWSFNILRATVLCENLEGQLQLYTFNPYNDFAPKFWNAVKEKDFQNKHEWTLFEKTFENLNFVHRK